MTKDEELDHLRQENQALHTTNHTLREGLLEAIHAIELPYLSCWRRISQISSTCSATCPTIRLAIWLKVLLFP